MTGCSHLGASGHPPGHQLTNGVLQPGIAGECCVIQCAYPNRNQLPNEQRATKNCSGEQAAQRSQLPTGEWEDQWCKLENYGNIVAFIK